MIASPEEIRELLSTVREILREHRRMALYAQAYKDASTRLYNGMHGTETHTTDDNYRHDRATHAVLAFDNMFKEES
jgi:hypothetical protein